MKDSKTEAFILKAKLVHGDKYDYSKVEYVKSSQKVCIICPEHGEFWTTPHHHLLGCNCPECAKKTLKLKRVGKPNGKSVKSQDEFIRKSINVHGDFYDYSKVNYVNNSTKVCIICPIHGEFWQTPSHHLNGHKCKKCGYDIVKHKKMIELDNFIKKANKVHNGKYDYSKVEYQGTHNKVCIICPEHGEFWITPLNHLQGRGCPECSCRKRRTTESFINEAKSIHGDKYDYSKVNFINLDTPVEIICPIHGSFFQTPYAHLHTHGCVKCSGYRHLTTDDFIERCTKIHRGFYDYSKVEYVNNTTKVCIICPEHGEFWQSAAAHLIGCGCPICRKSKLELEIFNEFPYLEKQMKFDWLKDNHSMSLDFYDNKLRVAIECQGKQHFEISGTSWYGNDFEKQKDVWRRDELKYQQCKEHGIDIIYYFPEDFLSYNRDFYKDKKCFHNIESLKEYLLYLYYE